MKIQARVSGEAIRLAPKRMTGAGLKS